MGSANLLPYASVALEFRGLLALEESVAFTRRLNFDGDGVQQSFLSENKLFLFNA